MTRVSSSHPPGKYYIGDICYALDATVYRDQWGKFGYEVGTYTMKHHDVKGAVSVNRTTDGDGVYTDTDGKLEFFVDSGTIGIVPFKLCCQKNIKDEKIRGGHFIESATPVEFKSSNGSFIIQYNGRHIVINT